MTANLHQLQAILSTWKGRNVKETYYEVYKTRTDFDRHMARRYDGMTGSRYLWVIMEQYREGLLTDTDLQKLSPDTQEAVKHLKSLCNGNAMKESSGRSLLHTGVLPDIELAQHLHPS